MRRLLWIILCLGPFALLAQESRYDISVSYGLYNAPNLPRAKAKESFTADFEYHLSKKWSISSGFARGRFAYFDNVHTAVFPDPDAGPTATNGKGYESHLYLSVAYSIINKSKLVLQAGTGAGMYTRTLKYPYRGPGSTDDRIFISETSFNKIEFPLKIDAYYQVNKRVGFGLKAGAFLLPDFSIVSSHIGPQIRVSL